MAYEGIDLVGQYKIYTDEIKEKVNQATKVYGKQMLAEVIKESPVRKGNKIKPNKREPGKYKAGWGGSVKTTGTRVTYTVKNKDYRLPHLLELPHHTGQTGKNRGEYDDKNNRAIGEIRKANKEYSDKLNEEIERILKK